MKTCGSTSRYVGDFSLAIFFYWFSYYLNNNVFIVWMFEDAITCALQVYPTPPSYCLLVFHYFTPSALSLAKIALGRPTSNLPLRLVHSQLIPSWKLTFLTMVFSLFQWHTYKLTISKLTALPAKCITIINNKLFTFLSCIFNILLLDFQVNSPNLF